MQTLVMPVNTFDNRFIIENVFVIRRDFKQFFIEDTVVMLDFSENEKTSLGIREVMERVKKNSYQFKI